MIKINHSNIKFNLILFLSGFIVYGIMGYFMSKIFNQEAKHLHFALFFGAFMGLAEILVIQPIKQYVNKRNNHEHKKRSNNRRPMD